MQLLRWKKKKRSNTADTPEVEIGWDFCQVPVRERLPFKLEKLLQGVTDTPVTLGDIWPPQVRV